MSKEGGFVSESNIEMGGEAQEGMTALTGLRQNYEFLLGAQQQYFDRDGHMDNWANDMETLEAQIGAQIARLEAMGQGGVANSAEESKWATKARGGSDEPTPTEPGLPSAIEVRDAVREKGVVDVDTDPGVDVVLP